MKVYIVHVGEYSDTYVDSAYTDESVAKNRAFEKDGWVEEFECDVKPVDYNYQAEWMISLKNIGNAERLYIERREYGYDSDLDGDLKIGDVYISNHGVWTLTTLVSGRDEEKAKKIATERFQKEFVRAALDNNPYPRAK